MQTGAGLGKPKERGIWLGSVAVGLQVGQLVDIAAEHQE
jgi:hypothetical protein